MAECMELFISVFVIVFITLVAIEMAMDKGGKEYQKKIKERIRRFKKEHT